MREKESKIERQGETREIRRDEREKERKEGRRGETGRLEGERWNPPIRQCEKVADTKRNLPPQKML